MRSSPTQSIEDGGSHRGPCGRRRGRARAGDREVDTGRVGEVGGKGVLWCTSSFGSSSSGGSSAVSSSSATSHTGLGVMKRRGGGGG
jgi:hypothetical protein